MERRKGDTLRSSPLPSDYTRMVEEVFTTNFDAGLRKVRALVEGDLSIRATGAIYPNEIVLSVSLIEQGQLAATTVHASADFDPKASAPTAQDLLAACVDAAGSVFGHLLDPDNAERLEQVASSSLSALDGIPFAWTETKLDRVRIHLKVDKSNPELDQQADDWLDKNDPEFRKKLAEEEAATEKLFVTGPSSKSKAPRGSGSGTLH